MITSPIMIDHNSIYPAHVAAQATGLSHEAIVAAIKRKELPANKRGRFWFVAGKHLAVWLAGVIDAEQAAKKC